MNDSSTGGYLVPAAVSPPLEDDDLDNLLQEMVAGISGLPLEMVRPRWQTTVPKKPEPSMNWCALGITAQPTSALPAMTHDPTGEGDDVFTRHQPISMLCSFYGPNAKRYAQQFADGLMIAQNREQIERNDMAVTSSGDIIAAPDFVNQQWIKRYDMSLTLARKITRTYPIRNLQSAEVSTTTDGTNPVTSNINIEP